MQKNGKFRTHLSSQYDRQSYGIPEFHLLHKPSLFFYFQPDGRYQTLKIAPLENPPRSCRLVEA